NRHWLFKTDPAEYSFLMLLEDKEYTWSNVSNIMEKKGIRNISKGDTIAFFHSGDEKKIIGTAEAVTNSYKKDEPNSSKIVIDIKPVKQLERPIALWELKLNPKFRNFDLLNIPELNIFSVNDEQWDEILIMSEGKV
ncbi:MAG: EVE domain-containing protein, partial [Ignavibacteriaceae bacterium]